MLNEMRNFCVTAECLNFTTAAKFLYIEQPALSKQISRLEEELGVKLFHRTTRRVSLTPAGEAFLQACRVFISACDALPKSFPHNSFAGSGRSLVIGIGETIDSGPIMSVLEGFFSDHEGVTLSFLRARDEKLPQLLVDEEADFIYTFLPILQGDVRYDFAPVKKIRLHVLLWKGHPLAEKDRIAVKDLRDEWLIMNSSAPPMLNTLHSICEANGFFPKVSAKVDSPELSMLMTSARQGVTISTFFGPELEAHSDLVVRELDPTDMPPGILENELVLAWRKDRYKSSELLRQFADSIRTPAPETPAPGL
jgi:DNA-binding transcriptional LysR family regulator